MKSKTRRVYLQGDETLLISTEGSKDEVLEVKAETFSNANFIEAMPELTPHYVNLVWVRTRFAGQTFLDLRQDEMTNIRQQVLQKLLPPEIVSKYQQDNIDANQATAPVEVEETVETPETTTEEATTNEETRTDGSVQQKNS